MLSYRHEFHAGNVADVLKHLVQIKTLEYLLKKQSPIVYIDTHAGAGVYSTRSIKIKTTGEYEAGFGALKFKGLPESTKVYAEQIAPYGLKGQYPGSPSISADLLRPQDQLRLFELHSADFKTLASLFKNDKRSRVENSDGFASLKALLPSKNKRALVLIDPSYELKTDYQKVASVVKEAWERMPNALFLVWYPVVNRYHSKEMIRKLVNAQVKNMWQFELGTAPDSPNELGMTASGVIVINPPWTLAEQLNEILPSLVRQLAPDHGHHLVQRLTEE
ncbi:MAG: 23S rRNA (adenine2030-N6)-methyltransferase [Lentisphaeria bacterium]|jgi:23S rRNA (adenine2030-N6)-methyltransferase